MKTSVRFRINGQITKHIKAAISWKVETMSPVCIYFAITRKRRFKRVVTYNTFEQSVNSASLNSAGILAVCLSNQSLAFYNSRSEEPHTLPVNYFAFRPSQELRVSRVTRFLRDDRLVIGFGPSPESLQIFDLGDGDLKQQDLQASESAISISQIHQGKPKVTSVYSLASLSPCGQAGGQQGDLFLSGGYDGIVRLLDLRCADRVVARFEDNVDQSAIYSLTSYGQERFVAGAARDAIMKVFDLRLPGCKKFYAANLSSYPALSSLNGTASPLVKDYDEGHAATGNEPHNCNIFLRTHSTGRRSYGVSSGSPIYSLSAPSEYSPTLFAGIEGQVLQLDLAAIMDRYPDPIYGSVPVSSNRAGDIQRKWNPHGKVLRLSMYQHPASTNQSVQLRTQRPVNYYQGQFWNLDERWDAV